MFIFERTPISTVAQRRMSYWLWGAAIATVAVFFFPKRVKQALFSLGYRAYRTRLGFLVHKHLLATAHGDPPHTDVLHAYVHQGFAVVPVCGFADNYAYILIDSATRAAAIVDAGDPVPLLARLADLNVQVRVVLTTHSHWDHMSGAAAVLAELSAAPGGGDVREVSYAAGARTGTTIELGETMVSVLESPGHTCDHLTFIVHPSRHATAATTAIEEIGVPDPRFPPAWTLERQSAAVFTGDLLFSLGCGKIFEGSAHEMWTAFSAIMALPDDTLLYVGHENTRKNAEFAVWVDPRNDRLRQKAEWVRKACEDSISTVPTRLGEEKACNPFLRADVLAAEDSSPVHKLGLPDKQQQDPVRVLALIRKLKDDGAHQSG